MGAIRRFNAFEDENSIFRFTIDTRIVVSGATNGSENPLTFKIPMIWVSGVGNETQCIIKVSDGRPDVSVINTAGDINAKSVLTFSTAGIYTITIVGKIGSFVGFNNSTYGYDKNKITNVSNWGNDVKYENQCFNDCVNLEITATNVLILPATANNFFRNIKGFPTKDLSNIQFVNVTAAQSSLSGVMTVFTSLYNVFMPNILTLQNLYNGVDVSMVSKIEIISNSVTSATGMFGLTLRNFSGELILSTPNNASIQTLCYYFNVTPSLAKVDIRSVTNALNFMRNPMTKAKTDDTLLGWVNNFDWSGIAPITNKVTLDFKGSTHSNITTVNNAKAFLIAKGYVFTNLTAV